jgi:hypothetical protein
MHSPGPPDQLPPDYYLRALAFWPRLDHPRPSWARHDPVRLAELISRRTCLPRAAILELIGAAELTGAPAAPDASGSGGEPPLTASGRSGSPVR